jgi:hypothetical protein
MESSKNKERAYAALPSRPGTPDPSFVYIITRFLAFVKEAFFTLLMKSDNNLPPELQHPASLLDAHPPEVQEAFQFLLATAMHEERDPSLWQV